MKIILESIEEVKSLLEIDGKSCNCPHCLTEMYVINGHWECYYCDDKYFP